jgi:hypothetical protein
MTADEIVKITVPCTFIVFLTFIVYIHAWRGRKARQIARDWLAQNSVEVVRARRSRLMNPFLWRIYYQIAYRIVVKDKNGVLRQGWLSIADWRFGLFPRTLEVCWDDDRVVQGFPVIFPLQNETK